MLFLGHNIWFSVESLANAQQLGLHQQLGLTKAQHQSSIHTGWLGCHSFSFAKGVGIRGPLGSHKAGLSLQKSVGFAFAIVKRHSEHYLQQHTPAVDVPFNRGTHFNQLVESSLDASNINILTAWHPVKKFTPLFQLGSHGITTLCVFSGPDSLSRPIAIRWVDMTCSMLWSLRFGHIRLRTRSAVDLGTW